MGVVMRKCDFVACEKQRPRLNSAFVIHFLKIYLNWLHFEISIYQPR